MFLPTHMISVEEVLYLLLGGMQLQGVILHFTRKVPGMCKRNTETNTNGVRPKCGCPHIMFYNAE